jgi:hypothetical protein
LRVDSRIKKCFLCSGKSRIDFDGYLLTID